MSIFRERQIHELSSHYYREIMREIIIMPIAYMSFVYAITSFKCQSRVKKILFTCVCTKSNVRIKKAVLQIAIGSKFINVNYWYKIRF